MEAGGVNWLCQGPTPEWCGDLEPLLPVVTKALDLNRDFSGVSLLVEESAHEETPWFTFKSPASREARQPLLEIQCGTWSFAPTGGRKTSLWPERQVWEGSEGAWRRESATHLTVDPERASLFLHHNLMLAQDLVRGEIPLDMIPRAQVEAFEAAWEVVVDGRLSRKGLPGYPLAERRAAFSRHFSSAGVLLPDHWQVFQALWDGGLESGRDVLAVLRQLPGF